MYTKTYIYLYIYINIYIRTFVYTYKGYTQSVTGQHAVTCVGFLW